MSDKRRVLVSGATGFVGRAIAGRLAADERYGVVALAGRAPQNGAELPAAAEVHYADITDAAAIARVGRDWRLDAVVHSAGLAHQFGPVREEEFRRVNVGGTEAVLARAAAAGARHFVQISTVAVYGAHGAAEVDETFETRGAGAYAATKLEAERRAASFCRERGIALTILRLATVIGEGDRGNTARLVAALDRRRFLWIGDGANRKSLIYVGDVARAVAAVLERAAAPAGARIFNVTAPPVAMREAVAAIAGALGKNPLPGRVPAGLVRAAVRLNERTLALETGRRIGRTLEKWLSDDVFSGRRFNEEYVWRPATDVRAALARQVAHYLERKTQ